MSLGDRGWRPRENSSLLSHCQSSSVQADQPGTLERAWQLTTDRLVDHDVEPCEAIDALEIGKLGP